MAVAKKKAARKSKPATAAASLPASSSLPPGMKAIGSGYAPSWDVETLRVLHGKVTSEVREVELKQGRKVNQRRCVEITNFEPEQRVTVWESAALGEFFDQLTELGSGIEVYLEFTGYGKKKAGQHPPKLFNVGIAE